jgi:hypothetical protein
MKQPLKTITFMPLKFKMKVLAKSEIYSLDLAFFDMEISLNLDLRKIHAIIETKSNF